MTGEGFFLDISKIAITFMGFATVVVAIRQPRREHWDSREVAGLQFMIEHATAAMVIGLFPFPLYAYYGDEATVWQMCSAALSVFFVVELLARRYGGSKVSLSRVLRQHTLRSCYSPTFYRL